MIRARVLGGYYRYGPRKIDRSLQLRFSRNDEVFGRARRKCTTALCAASQAGPRLCTGRAAEDVRYRRLTMALMLTPDQFGLETSGEAAKRAETQEHVWNEVWKRRIVYFPTVGVSLWLALYPLVRKLPAQDEYHSPIRWISDIIRLVGGFLPGFAQTWINGYARSPVQFSLLSPPCCADRLERMARDRHFRPHGHDLAKDPRRQWACRPTGSTGCARAGPMSGFTGS